MTRDDQQFSEATRLLTRGELPAAQALFEALLERHPRHFDSLRRLAWIAVQRSKFSDAVSHTVLPRAGNQTVQRGGLH
ncbi:MAG: hypothetical protein EBR18_07375 [Betaproteobacteria bacterium]|nr:hypothetical protein [Betaproteobacteria bacterium]